jgi:hypothetical protein
MATEQSKSLAPSQNFVVPTQSPIRIVNSGGTTQSAIIRNPVTGKTDEIFVQPGGKPRIPLGWKLDPVYAARHPQVYEIKES